VRKYSFSISSKTVQSQSIAIKLNSINCKKESSESKRKKTNSRFQKSESFECDKNLQTRTKSISSMLREASEQNSSNFRRQFYQTNRDSIKFSLKGHPHIKITNIRLAHANESVQKDFMKTFKKESSHSPQLVTMAQNQIILEAFFNMDF
ncbi:unnamed protein product, partial [Rotaria socialis]